jgi:hypothetical protein
MSKSDIDALKVFPLKRDLYRFKIQLKLLLSGNLGTDNFYDF